MKLLLLSFFLFFDHYNAAYKLQLQNADRGYPVKEAYFQFGGNVTFTIKDYEVKCDSAVLDTLGIVELYNVKISSFDTLTITSGYMKYNETNGTAFLKEKITLNRSGKKTYGLKEAVFSFADRSLR